MTEVAILTCFSLIDNYLATDQNAATCIQHTHTQKVGGEKAISRKIISFQDDL